LASPVVGARARLRLAREKRRSSRQGADRTLLADTLEMETAFTAVSFFDVPVATAEIRRRTRFLDGVWNSRREVYVYLRGV